MFGKCLKHEFRATRRQLVPLFIAMLAVGLLAGLLVALGGLLLSSDGGALYAIVNGLLPVLLIIGLFALMVAVEVVAFVMIIRRFYTSFFTDEGYLSFTLPVTATEHILSKFIVAAVWQIAAGIVSLLAVALIVGGALLGYGVPEDFAEVMALFWEEFSLVFVEFGSIFGVSDACLPVVVILLALIMIISVASSIFLLYFSISLGCMLAKKHRVIAGIVCYYVVSTAFSIISSVLQTIIQFVTLGDTSNFEPFMIATLIMSLVLVLVQLIVCYIGTKWVLTKKLNLD